MKYEYAIVFWKDAFFEYEDENNTDGLLTLSIGWVVQDDKRGMKLAQDRYGPDTDYSKDSMARSFIPRSMIVKVIKRTVTARLK